MHIPLILIGVVVVLFLVVRLFGPSVDRALETALRDKNLDELGRALEGVSPAKQANAYNRVIRRLWDAYEREMAAALVRKLAEARPDERIAQYWLDQVQRVEPELSRKMFEAGFLEQHFRPEVAQRCGSFG
jgi:hypothetical protein